MVVFFSTANSLPQVFFPESLSVCPCWGPKAKWGSQKSKQHDHLGNLKKLTLWVRALAFATKNLTNALQLGMQHRLHLSGEPDRPSDLAHGRCMHAMLGGCSSRVHAPIHLEEYSGCTQRFCRKPPTVFHLAPAPSWTEGEK